MQTTFNHVNKLSDKVLTLNSDSLFEELCCYEINDTKIVSIVAPHFDINLISAKVTDHLLKVSFYAQNHVYFGTVDKTFTTYVGNYVVYNYFLVDNVLQIILKPNY